jgi:hypothetical protein
MRLWFLRKSNIKNIDSWQRAITTVLKKIHTFVVKACSPSFNFKRWPYKYFSVSLPMAAAAAGLKPMTLGC